MGRMGPTARLAAGSVVRCAPREGGDQVKGLMSDYQLTLPAILRRAEEIYGKKEIVTRNPDKSFHRYTYADFARRAKKLAVALGNLGLEKSARVVTLAWNTYQH